MACAYSFFYFELKNLKLVSVKRRKINIHRVPGSSKFRFMRRHVSTQELIGSV